MSRRLSAPPPPARSPWQRFYGACHALRWRWHAPRARRLPRPVVSVGNLHWGGAGKTPVVAAVAAHLRERGFHPAVLSRGYRGRARGVRLVSGGGGPLLGPRLAGDEPVLLAGELPGVAVLVGTDRYAAGRHALERVAPTPDVFVLDDGFSHLALFRDLDLLVFPAADPWAGGRLPPGGRLREPLAAAARADGALVTGADPGAGDELAAALRAYGFTGAGFASRTRPLPARLDTGEALPAAVPVLVVAAIARPESFLATVRRQGHPVADTLFFPDHHGYPPASLERIATALRAAGAEAVLTTAKDRVKLSGRLELPLAELPIRAEPEPAFWRWLDRRLEQQLAVD